MDKMHFPLSDGPEPLKTRIQCYGVDGKCPQTFMFWRFGPPCSRIKGGAFVRWLGHQSPYLTKGLIHLLIQSIRGLREVPCYYTQLSLWFLATRMYMRSSFYLGKISYFSGSTHCSRDGCVWDTCNDMAGPLWCCQVSGFLSLTTHLPLPPKKSGSLISTPQNLRLALKRRDVTMEKANSLYAVCC
jgi:hypothetical protein